MFNVVKHSRCNGDEIHRQHPKQYFFSRAGAGQHTVNKVYIELGNITFLEYTLPIVCTD